MPWQLPMAAFMFLCALLFAVWQPFHLRGQPAPPAPERVVVPPAGPTPTSSEALALAPTPAAILTAPPSEATATPALNLGGDPLDDPTVGRSRLDNADQINILLLGTDGRDEEDGPPRTDLMMLLLLDRAAPRATIISIPRDLWVPIPGYGEGKINTAFFLGSLEDSGQELAKETVEELFGIRITHTVQVNFNGFREVVDELGGIELTVPETIDDPEYPDGNYGTLHLHIPAGRQQMDGETALRYARTRHGGVDQDRSERQQAVMLAIRKKALEPSQLARAPFLLRTAYRTVESTLSLSDFFALARLGRSLEQRDISLHTLQADGELVWPVITWNGQDALMYDRATLYRVVQGWMAGEEGQ